MNIIFFDTETTGNTDQDRLLQLAVKERGVETPRVNAIYQPPVPISIESMAIHHITERKTQKRPRFTESSEYFDIKKLFESDGVVAVAHNANFDIAMLAREEIVPRLSICTYKVARALDPNELIENYRLQYLRYLLGLEIDAAAHDALGDVIVLEAIFERLLAKMVKQFGDEDKAMQEMINISARPLLYTTLRFGKHKGKKIEDVARTDPGYLEWLLHEKRKNSAEETDWIYTLEHYLQQSTK